MDIVLLGATGFVGQAVLKELLLRPDLRCVHVLVRRPWQGSTDPRIRPVIGSLPDVPADLLPKDRDYAIVHFASIQRTADPAELGVNQAGIENLLRLAGKNCRSFIFGSSMSVHGQGKQVFVNERSPCQPETPLAESRFLCEETISNQCKARDMGFALLRPRFILDVNDPSTLKPWIKLAKAGVLMGDGRQRFSVIERADYARIICDLALSPKKIQGPIPVGYSQPLVYGELWRWIRQRLQLSERSRLRIPARPGILALMHRSRLLAGLAVKIELMGYDHFADVTALRHLVKDEIIDRDPLAVTRQLVEKSLAAHAEKEN